MGIIIGVHSGNEPTARGYLRGQIWNRPTVAKASYLCFRLIHDSLVANDGGNGYLTSAAFYFLGGPAGEDYSVPLSGEALFAHFRRMDEPGYYSGLDSSFNPSALILSQWVPPDGQPLTWSPRIQYQDLIPFADISNRYYYDAIRPNLFWSKEASLIRVQGFDSLPLNTLQAGGLGIDVEWAISDVFFDDNRRAIDLSLDLASALGLGYRYLLIEFSVEAGFYDAANSRPAILNRVASISASLAVSAPPDLNEWKLYPSYATEELEAVSTDPLLVDKRHDYDDGVKFASTRAFLYDIAEKSGRWVQEPINYVGF